MELSGAFGITNMPQSKENKTNIAMRYVRLWQRNRIIEIMKETIERRTWTKRGWRSFIKKAKKGTERGNEWSREYIYAPRGRGRGKEREESERREGEREGEKTHRRRGEIQRGNPQCCAKPARACFTLCKFCEPKGLFVKAELSARWRVL